MVTRITKSEREQILLYRKHHPTASQKEIADKFNRSVSAIGNVIRDGKKKGIKGL